MANIEFGLHQFVMAEYNRLRDKEDIRTAKANLIKTLMKEAVYIAQSDKEHEQEFMDLMLEPAIQRLTEIRKHVLSQANRYHAEGNVASRDRALERASQIRAAIDVLNDRVQVP